VLRLSRLDLHSVARLTTVLRHNGRTTIVIGPALQPRQVY
jgi:hypothetical protein